MFATSYMHPSLYPEGFMSCTLTPAGGIRDHDCLHTEQDLPAGQCPGGSLPRYSCMATSASSNTPQGCLPGGYVHPGKTRQCLLPRLAQQKCSKTKEKSTGGRLQLHQPTLCNPFPKFLVHAEMCVQRDNRICLACSPNIMLLTCSFITTSW